MFCRSLYPFNIHHYIVCHTAIYDFGICKLFVRTLQIESNPFIFSSTFRRKKVELLSSLRRQRLRQCQRQRLGRLSFRLSFLSESISQKLSKISIWNLEYLFTIKRGTNYNKADDPVICISRVICPCFDKYIEIRDIFLV